jgi:hypothetical protein
MLMQHTTRSAGGVNASPHIKMVLQSLVDKGISGRVRSLPHIIGLMSVQELRQSILEGAIASIGGVDQTLSQAAANALVAMVLTPDLRLTDGAAGKCQGVQPDP